MAELDTTIETIETTETNEDKSEVESTTENAEIARLKAELAKQKAATDKATKEAGDIRKQLRAKQSAEEIAAEEAKTLQETMKAELEQLRKEKAVAATTAKLVPLVGGNNEVAEKISEYLYGAEDIDAALDEIKKAWTAKEKALRMEFGKIPAPGVGNSDGVTITKAQLDAMSYKDRLKFAREHSEEYNKALGR